MSVWKGSSYSFRFRFNSVRYATSLENIYRIPPLDVLRNAGWTENCKISSINSKQKLIVFLRSLTLFIVYFLKAHPNWRKSFTSHIYTMHMSRRSRLALSVYILYRMKGGANLGLLLKEVHWKYNKHQTTGVVRKTVWST